MGASWQDGATRQCWQVVGLRTGVAVTTGCVSGTTDHRYRERYHRPRVKIKSESADTARSESETSLLGCRVCLLASRYMQLVASHTVPHRHGAVRCD